MDGLLLADHPLAQVVLHMQKLLVFALHESSHRDAGPVSNNLCHGIRIHMIRDHGLLCGASSDVSSLGTCFIGGILSLLGGILRLGQLLANARDLSVEDAGSLLQVALTGGLVGLDPLGIQLSAQVADLVVASLLVLPTGLEAAQLLAGIRQLGLQLAQTVLGGRVISFLQLHLLHLQTGDAALKLHGGLAHEDLLEAALQSRILLDVLPIFVQGGGADQTQFSSGQHGFKHVARVHGPFDGTRPDDGVDLIDEGDDLTVGALDLIENGLETLLEFATVFAASHHRAQIEGDQSLPLQGGGHVAGHDTLSQALDHGRLAHAGLADKDRVVLGPPGQDLHDTANLLVPADDRVQLALLGLCSQIGGVLLQSLIGALGIWAGHLGTAAHLWHGLAQGIGLQTASVQNIGSLRGTLGDGDEQVLGGDVLVTHGLHFLLRLGKGHAELTAGLGLRGRGTTGRRKGHQGLTDLGSDPLAVAAGRLDQSRNHAGLLTQQRVQQMEHIHLGVASRRGRLDSIAYGLLSHGGEVFVHRASSNILRRGQPNHSTRPRHGFICFLQQRKEDAYSQT